MGFVLLFILGFIVGVWSNKYTLPKFREKLDRTTTRQVEDYWSDETHTFYVGEFIAFKQEDGVYRQAVACIDSHLFVEIVRVMPKKTIFIDFTGFDCPKHVTSEVNSVVTHMVSMIRLHTGYNPECDFRIDAGMPPHVAETLRHVQKHACSH